MKLLSLLATVLLVVGAGSTVHGQEANTSPVLQPGDAVRVTVWRKPELSGQFSITEAGTINHPLYREISVAGVPLPAAESRVREFLIRLEANPQFVLEPLLRVSVGGEVRQPSLYRLPPETSIAEAVAQAGGITDQGRMNKVRLLRDGREILVDLTSPELGLAQESIRSGDQIFVERRTHILRDYIAPAGGLLSALGWILNLVIL